MPRPESKSLGSLYDRFIGDDPDRVASYEKALANAEVASAIYELRTKARLTQPPSPSVWERPHRSSAGWKIPTTTGIPCRCSGVWLSR